MSEAATGAAETLTTGGFRIEIRPDELTVVAEPLFLAKLKNWNRKLRLVGLASLFVPIFCIIELVESPPTLSSLHDLPAMLKSSGPEPASLRWVFPLLWLVMIALSLLGAMLKGHDTLRCTRDEIEVIHTFRGRVRRQRSFSKAAVKRVQLGSAHLMFYVSGKRTQCLLGLKSIEAQRILSELRRLGFDAVDDIGMPMAVEIEQASRNFWFSK